MVQNNLKLSIIFILIASAIAPVVAPPPPVPPVGHVIHESHNNPLHDIVHNPPGSPPSSSPAGRPIRPLPQADLKGKARALNSPLDHGSPNNPPMMGGGATHSTAQTHHHDEFEQGSSKNPIQPSSPHSSEAEPHSDFKFVHWQPGQDSESDSDWHQNPSRKRKSFDPEEPGSIATPETSMEFQVKFKELNSAHARKKANLLDFEKHSPQ